MSSTFPRVTTYNGFSDFIYHSDFTPYYPSEDIEFLWFYLSNLIKSVCDLFNPIISAHSNQQPPWFNSDIKHHINCLRTLKRKHSAHPTEHNHSKLVNSQDQLLHKINNAKSRYESDLMAGLASNNNSKIFKYIRNFTKSTPIPSTLFYDSSPISSDKANLFNNHFYSIFTKPPCTTFHYDNPTSFSNITITEEEASLRQFNQPRYHQSNGSRWDTSYYIIEVRLSPYRPLHYLI